MSETIPPFQKFRRTRLRDNLLLNTSIISFIHNPESAQYLKGILRSPSLLYEHKLPMDSNTLIRYFPNSSLKLLQTYLRLCQCNKSGCYPLRDSNPCQSVCLHLKSRTLPSELIGNLLAQLWQRRDIQLQASSLHQEAQFLVTLNACTSASK